MGVIGTQEEPVQKPFCPCHPFNEQELKVQEDPPDCAPGFNLTERRLRDGMKAALQNLRDCYRKEDADLLF